MVKIKTSQLGGMNGKAIFSDCEKYRFTLERDWSNKEEKNIILFLMLNPSTATEEKFDPTIKRCFEYSKRWNFNVLWIANIYAYRATDPKDMLKAKNDGIDIIPEKEIRNDYYIRWMCEKANKIILAWGSHKWSKERTKKLWNEILCDKMIVNKVYCLKKTKDGSPSHPLYLKSDLVPLEYKYE